MNIFEDASGFLGEINPEGFENSFSECFHIAASIREKLGNRRALLAEYLKNGARRRMRKPD